MDPAVLVARGLAPASRWSVPGTVQTPISASYRSCDVLAVTSRPATSASDLAAQPLPDDVTGLLEGLTTTRAIRRYRDEPVPDDALRDMLFAATRAPSGSNRQPFRFIVLTDGPKAREAKRIIGASAQGLWGRKRDGDGY